MVVCPSVVRDDGLGLGLGFGQTPAPRGAAARGGSAADGVRDGHRVVLLQCAQLGKEKTLEVFNLFKKKVPRGTRLPCSADRSRSQLPSAFPVTVRGWNG